MTTSTPYPVAATALTADSRAPRAASFCATRLHLHRKNAFTLIELLVVIVIIAILLAIALPAYLSQQVKAKDSAAKQYLTTAWKNARSEAVTTSGLFPTDAAALAAAIAASEPAYTVVAGSQADVDPANDKKIVIDTASLTTTHITLYVQSKSGTVYSLSASNTDVPVMAAAAPLTDAQLADAMLDKAYVASGQYNTANGASYTGMTTTALRVYDASINPAVRVKSASAASYCIDYIVNATARQINQTNTKSNGTCP